jgi:hypothetical protein
VRLGQSLGDPSLPAKNKKPALVAGFLFLVCGAQEANHVRQFCQEQNWTAEGWPREAGLVPWMGPTILVSHYSGEPSLLGTSCASPFGPSASPMFAPASCLRSRQNLLERFWTAEGWPREAGLVPWMGPTILVVRPMWRPVTLLAYGKLKASHGDRAALFQSGLT